MPLSEQPVWEYPVLDFSLDIDYTMAYHLSEFREGILSGNNEGWNRYNDVAPPGATTPHSFGREKVCGVFFGPGKTP